MQSDQNQYWSMTEGVFNCLIDTERTEAFQKAIRNTVKRGDIVVDLGSGSGVMAMFAADAGAAKVYAVEIDLRNIKTLRDTFAKNGYADVITVIEGDATSVVLPEKVDVIIAEMVATGLIEELQIPAMNNALMYKKERTRVVLSRIDNYIDLVFNNPVFYNHTFNIFRYEYPDIEQLRSNSFSDRIIYSSIDFNHVCSERNVDATYEVSITNDGVINALRISTDTFFADNSTLGPTYAYAYPLILPIPESKVKKGDIFSVKVSYELCGGFDGFSYSVTKKNV
jgi:predicted RNA methylase